MTTEIDLGQHFDRFVRDQIDSGRFRDAAEVVQAGLRLLEEQDGSTAMHRDVLIQDITDAFEDPRPDLPADGVFERLERRHAARTSGRRD